MRKLLVASLTLALFAAIAIENRAVAQPLPTGPIMQSGNPPPACQPYIKCPPVMKKAKTGR